MVGKPITRGSRRVADLVDRLSKNTLADIVLDRVGAEIGEDATDEQVLAHLQRWLDTVLRLRGDRPLNLLAVQGGLDRAEARYLGRERLGQEKAAAAPSETGPSPTRSRDTTGGN
jgi:hypothetical protein